MANSSCSEFAKNLTQKDASKDATFSSSKIQNYRGTERIAKNDSRSCESQRTGNIHGLEI